jgi:hypothetical protein
MPRLIGSCCYQKRRRASMHESGVRVRCRSWRSGRALLSGSNGATVTSSHAGRPLFPLRPLRRAPGGVSAPVLPQGTHWSQQQYSRNFRDQSSSFLIGSGRAAGPGFQPGNRTVRTLRRGERNVFGAADGFVREAGRRMLPRPLSDGRPHACPPRPCACAPPGMPPSICQFLPENGQEFAPKPRLLAE